MQAAPRDRQRAEDEKRDQVERTSATASAASGRRGRGRRDGHDGYDGLRLRAVVGAPASHDKCEGASGVRSEGRGSR
jgi:hypothetical protein